MCVSFRNVFELVAFSEKIPITTDKNINILLLANKKDCSAFSHAEFNNDSTLWKWSNFIKCNTLVRRCLKHQRRLLSSCNISWDALNSRGIRGRKSPSVRGWCTPLGGSSILSSFPLIHLHCQILVNSTPQSHTGASQPKIIISSSLIWLWRTCRMKRIHKHVGWRGCKCGMVVGVTLNLG